MSLVYNGVVDDMLEVDETIDLKSFIDIVRCHNHSEFCLQKRSRPKGEYDHCLCKDGDICYYHLENKLVLLDHSLFECPLKTHVYVEKI